MARLRGMTEGAKRYQPLSLPTSNTESPPPSRRLSPSIHLPIRCANVEENYAATLSHPAPTGRMSRSAALARRITRSRSSGVQP